MKRIFLLLNLFLIMTSSVMASENSVKLHYQPGMSLDGGRFMDISIRGGLQ